MLCKDDFDWASWQVICLSITDNIETAMLILEREPQAVEILLESTFFYKSVLFFLQIKHHHHHIFPFSEDCNEFTVIISKTNWDYF